MADYKFSLVLDAVAPTNRNPYFYPANISLRGEARWSELTSLKPNGALVKLKEIPGHRLMLDMDAKFCRVIDRMNLPENRDKDAMLREIVKTKNYLWCAFGKYDDDRDYHISPSDWPTWLWHIRCMVNHRRLSVVRGEKLVPTPDEIYVLSRQLDAEIRLGDPYGIPSRDPNKPFNAIGPHNARDFVSADACAMSTSPSKTS